METIIKIALPLKRNPAPDPKWRKMYPFAARYFWWLYSWGGGGVGNCSGQTNTVRHLSIFRWHILTIHRNEYHNRSDAERASEYLRRWSECEKELRGLRLIMLGDETSSEVKKVIKESLGVDLDEGRVL